MQRDDSGDRSAVEESPRTPCGVYVVTSPGDARRSGHLHVGLAAVEGSADALQLRAPELTDDELLTVAATLAERCRRAGVLFVVNDRIEVALEVGADGVHLGRHDHPEAARRRLGHARTLGVSVGTEAEARWAAAFGADYLGVTVWASPTKPEATPVGLAGLRTVARATPLPVVGIGGIRADNAAQVIEAGARAVAVISAVGAAPDPTEVTRVLVAAVGAASRERPDRGEP
ncbi:MAG: thiamine phosphate synthase [Acidimicrobiales bacterium]|jgi:thiamine-phosphate pyrophosphorylase